METNKALIDTNLSRISRIKIKKVYLFLFLGIVLIKFLFLPIFGDDYDLGLHSQWGNFLLRNPVTEIYTKTNCNLPPFWVYLLWFFSKIHFLITGKMLAIYSEALKIPGVLFDIFTGLLIFIFLLKEKIEEKKAFLASTLFLLNPFVLYLSSVWGQLDSIYVFFVLLSFIFLYQKKIMPASIFLVLSFLTKLQGIIFFPLFFFLLLRNYPLKKILVSLLVLFVTIFIILSPFLIKGISLGFIFEKTWLASWQRTSWLSLNAFNLWWLPQIILHSFTSQSPALEISYFSDQISFLGPITFKIVGLILFSLFYLLILLRANSIFGCVHSDCRSATHQLAGSAKAGYSDTVIYSDVPIRIAEARRAKAGYSDTFFLAGLVGLLFFMVPTAMHERYIFPFFAFFSLLWPKEKKYLAPYLWLTLTSFLNLILALPPTIFQEATRKMIVNFVGELSILLTLINIFIFFYLFFLLIKDRNKNSYDEKAFSINSTLS